MYRFFLPLSYGWSTRSQTPLDRLSFFVILVLPLWYCSAVSASAPLQAVLPPFAIAFVAQYALYEIGYLQNDCVTTRFESSPHFRLPAPRQEAAARLYPLLTATRLAFACACLALLTRFFPAGRVYRFAALLLMQTLAFGAHNTLRSRWNIATYLALCTLKYAAVPLLFAPSVWPPPPAAAAMFFAFPLPRAVEHASKEKYGIKLLRSLNPDRFRLAYYALLSIITCTLALLRRETLPAALLSLWFYGYRAAVAGALSLSSRLRKKYRAP